jgi:L-rhamnose mutarotase
MNFQWSKQYHRAHRVFWESIEAILKQHDIRPILHLDCSWRIRMASELKSYEKKFNFMVIAVFLKPYSRSM